MTESPGPRRLRLWGMMTATRGRANVVILSLVVILCGAVALAVVPAIADDEKLAGVPVPAEDLPAVVAAALSCPTLNPPRVAAQLMAASGFSDGAEHGNIAAMNAEAWSRWRPWATARPTDRAAAITALAHRTCGTVGELRAAGLSGDLWPAAVAAERAGVEAVAKAKGVPDAAREHVETVAAYAHWYADQPEFSVAPQPAVAGVRGSASGAVPVPDDLVSIVRAAGAICPAITPVRIAAQLRALSNFNKNLRSANGAEGIAQFTPQRWEEYQNRRGASVWNPVDAIPVMGVAMCELTRQLGGLGGDSYVLALGAYQWGEMVIRQAGGLPRTTVPQLADTVLAHTAEYEKDTRARGPGQDGVGDRQAEQVGPGGGQRGRRSPRAKAGGQETALQTGRHVLDPQRLGGRGAGGARRRRRPALRYPGAAVAAGPRRQGHALAPGSGRW